MEKNMYIEPDLARLVNPRSIALVGASDRVGSIGARALENLVAHSSFSGDLYLVNPTRSDIGGRKCWPDVASLPVAIDLAVITIPAAAVLPTIKECVEREVRFCILLTSGFGETGEAGLAAEQEILRSAQLGGMRLYGPNCPGLTNINERLGFTFSPAFASDLLRGPIGVVTQGGGMGRNILQAMDRGVGFGLWASTGNEVDLQVADFIRYMADDDAITVIATVMEGIKDGARFIKAARYAASRGKPIVALKIGKSAYGQKAAQSHTASITGSSDVNSAVFRQLGIIEVDDVDELVDVASLLTRQRPTGQGGTTIYGGSGGALAHCADMIGLAGLRLAEFSAETTQALRAALPSFAAIGNPVDTTAGVISDPGMGERALQILGQDEETSLILAPMPLDYGLETELMAKQLLVAQESTEVPIVPIWMTDRVGEGYDALVKGGMPPLRSVRNAALCVKRWHEYGQWATQVGLGSEPLLLSHDVTGPARPTRVIAEAEAKRWLSEFGLPVPRSIVSLSKEQAVGAARGFGRAVVLKVVSADITHKSDIGGVVLDLVGDEAVASAWDRIDAAVRSARPDATVDGILVEEMAERGGVEAFIGVSRDPVFGHVLTFGLGGVHVEMFRDVARRLLPLDPRDVDAMLSELRSGALLRGARGARASDLSALRDILLGVSRFVEANAEAIEEMDLNPVWVGAEGEGALLLDAVILWAGDTAQDA
jgi:acyl-CoA synthetase (NDP forming)